MTPTPVLYCCASSPLSLLQSTLMEKLKKMVSEIAYTKDFSNLSLSHRSLLPILSGASFLYSLSLSIRHHLYLLGILHKHRLPMPVISVGNLTWGGNGKTPMVEFLSLWFSHSGISPLILSRGYAGGDEARMLGRHLVGTSAKIGIGANRATTAASFLEKFGHVDSWANGSFKSLLSQNEVQTDVSSDKIGAAILDDGMQHIGLSRDLEIVMINALMPWGNNQLLPLGPLREPLHALVRADIVVIHHADLVSEQNLVNLKLRIQEIKETLPIFFSRMAPSHFLTIQDIHLEIPLSAVENRVLLCVSAIGSPDAFVKCIKKLGPLHVDWLHYSDHYSFQPKDILVMKKRLEQLQHNFGSKPIVVTTEKDYDRDREVLLQLHPFDVLILCSWLKFVPHCETSEDSFKELVKQHLDRRFKEIYHEISS